jgi:phage gp45-like
MPDYRNGRDFISGIAGKARRTIVGMISRRWLLLTESTGDRVTALGREADDGSFERDTMDMFSPVGIIGRPADDAEVEAAVSFIGGDGAHPIALSCLDGTRRAVIDVEGLDADEVIVYTSGLVLKLTASGTIEARALGGAAESLAFTSALQSVNDRITALENNFSGHTHGPGSYSNSGGTVGGTSGGAAPSETSATVEGTTVFKGG